MTVKPMDRAVFLHGSTLRHVVTMTSASAVGLVAMFAVDMTDMYFLTLLGEQELAAAVGFAGTLLFFLQRLAYSVGSFFREQYTFFCILLVLVTR